MELVSLLVTAMSAVLYIIVAIFIVVAIIAIGLLVYAIHVYREYRLNKKYHYLYINRRTTLGIHQMPYPI